MVMETLIFIHYLTNIHNMPLFLKPTISKLIVLQVYQLYTFHLLAIPSYVFSLTFSLMCV
jgi:hypothetical protein